VFPGKVHLPFSATNTLKESVMKTVHYASYERNGQEEYGTAELLNGSGYLFRRDGERQAVLVSYRDPNLLLFGIVQLADQQYLDDEVRGGAAAIACSREQEVR
jgi:hypothetical protein